MSGQWVPSCLRLYCRLRKPARLSARGGGRCVLGHEPVELAPSRGQQRLFHQVPARAATVVEVVADRLVLDLGHAPKRWKQLRQKLELPHPFAWTARVEHIAVVVVVLEQDV